jgi:hypothetical protein
MAEAPALTLGSSYRLHETHRDPPLGYARNA